MQTSSAGPVQDLLDSRVRRIAIAASSLVIAVLVLVSGAARAVARPAVPLLTFLVLAAAALVVANLVAVLPGRAAARLQPAPVLRSE